jgi:hypothetical protein
MVYPISEVSTLPDITGLRGSQNPPCFFQQRRCWIAKKTFSATGQQQVIQDPKAKTEDV